MRQVHCTNTINKQCSGDERVRNGSRGWETPHITSTTSTTEAQHISRRPSTSHTPGSTPRRPENSEHGPFRPSVPLWTTPRDADAAPTTAATRTCPSGVSWNSPGLQLHLDALDAPGPQTRSDLSGTVSST